MIQTGLGKGNGLKKYKFRTLETFDQMVEDIEPDQQKVNDNGKVTHDNVDMSLTIDTSNHHLPIKTMM